MTETLRNAGKPGVDENDGTVVGVILAGGLSRRMGGGDKCLHPLAGRPMLDHVIDRFAPQVSRLALNANGDPARFAAWPLPVIPDIIKGHAGPLAGVLTAMAWAKQSSPSVQWVATVAADTPFLPADLVSSLMSAANKESLPLAVARSAGRHHPVFGLWDVGLFADLHMAVFTEGVRKVDSWTARHRIAEVGFSAPSGDPFFNVNTPDDLTAAETLLAENS